MYDRAPSAIRQLQPEALAPDEETIELEGEGDLGSIDHEGDVLVIELPGGAVNINLSPLKHEAGGDASDHDENLADHVDEGELGSIADNLLRLVEDDLRRQEQRLADVVKGIDLLGIKLEQPRTEPTEEGLSVVRHPLLLEAILRFQANARGEFLPADGPAKIHMDEGETRVLDEMATALERDFNAYLTTGAPEYYPDFDRMLFSLGHGGEAYKKVYRHPLKRRPVSDTIDRKDLILSDGAVSLEACGRVTHRSRVKPSDVKRMQLAGVWRDCPLGQATLSAEHQVDLKLALVAGVAPKTSIEPEELDREIWEIYCELNLNGFEHVEDGKETGLSLPYRVTIDKDSRQVLEIRKWWNENDDTFTREETFVEYVFVPAFPGVNLGLLHILGNASRALTAAWRIALDNGMYANFPGGLMARAAGRQQTTNVRPAPGTFAPVDTDGRPIREAFMELPYRDVTPGFLGIVNNIEQASQRVGGTAETSVGEGNQNAPVGTTLALIEQATMVLNAVHKRMHTAQAKEFKLLMELFRRDPECLWRGNAKTALPQDAGLVVAALDDNKLVPKSDPNTASQTQRIQKALALMQRADAHPERYDGLAVEKRVLGMIGISDADDLLAKQAPQPQIDPTRQMDSQAKMLAAQAKMAQVQIDAQNAKAELGLRLQEAQTKALDSQTDAANRAADRESDERLELLRVGKELGVHPETASAVEHFLHNPPTFGNPTGGQGPI